MLSMCVWMPHKTFLRFFWTCILQRSPVAEDVQRDVDEDKLLSIGDILVCALCHAGVEWASIAGRF